MATDKRDEDGKGPDREGEDSFLPVAPPREERVSGSAAETPPAEQAPQGSMVPLETITSLRRDGVAALVARLAQEAKVPSSSSQESLATALQKLDSLSSESPSSEGERSEAQLDLQEAFDDFFSLLWRLEEEHAQQLLQAMVERFPEALWQRDLGLIDLFCSGFLRGEKALAMLSLITEKLPGHPLAALCAEHLPGIVELRQALSETPSLVEEGAEEKLRAYFTMGKYYLLNDYPLGSATRYSMASSMLKAEGKRRNNPQWTEAAKSWGELAISLDPTVARRQVRLFLSYIDSGQLDRALKVFRPEAQFSPRDLKDLHRLFRSLLEQCKELHLTDFESKGEAQREERRLKEAQTFRRILGVLTGILQPLQGEEFEGYYTASLNALDEMIEEVAAFERVMDGQPIAESDVDTSSPGHLLAYAQQLCDANEHEKALLWLMKSWEIKPQDPSTAFQFAVCYEALERNLEALPYARIAAESFPGQSDPQLILGRVLLACGQGQEALATLEKALRLGRSHQTLFALAWAKVLLQQDNDPEEPAEVLLEEAEHLAPGSEYADPYRAARCLLLIGKDRTEEAIALALQLSSETTDSNLLAFAAGCLCMLGKREEALATVARAVQGDPQWLDLSFRIAAGPLGQGELRLILEPRILHLVPKPSANDPEI